MTILHTVPTADASGAVASIYAADTLALGYVPSHTQVLSLNPEAYLAFEHLLRTIAGSMDQRRYELITLAAAQGVRSPHCRLAHGFKSLRYIDEEQLVRIARNYRDAGLSEAEVAVMDFAERLSSAASAGMNDDDAGRLRELGLSDREIVDITLVAAARNYFSRALQALAPELDIPPGLSAELQEALLEPL
jgi:uncharacterized peroxidase-related enzyme